MLGEQIKKLRIAKHINQVQLAEYLGVTKQSISNWENNNILPSVDMLKKIAQFFNCSPVTFQSLWVVRNISS